jgi:hypothetical protein
LQGFFEMAAGEVPAAFLKVASRGTGQTVLLFFSKDCATPAAKEVFLRLTGRWQVLDTSGLLGGSLVSLKKFRRIWA